MDPAWYGFIELVFIFGIVLAFAAWQLLDLRRLRKEREKRERDGKD